jgi:hypothetical protein
VRKTEVRIIPGLGGKSDRLLESKITLPLARLLDKVLPLMLPPEAAIVKSAGSISQVPLA